VSDSRSTPVSAPAPHADVLIATENLCRFFGSGPNQVRAVYDVTLQFKSGEIVSIVGESGSGKSTLARLLLGLLPATSGTILYRGKDASHLRGAASRREYWREVQAVFQDPFASFNQFFTVARVLQRALHLSAERLSRSARTQVVRHCLRDVKLDPDDVLQKKPHELSGGQRQRVMIARALMLRPRLLIADEPTTMIDASSRASVLNALLDLHRAYRPTIVFITHDISLAAYVSDRLLIMKSGQVVEQGPAEVLLKNPQHPYTKQLFKDTFSLTAAEQAPQR